MENWINYAKAKGTSNINGINQHRIIYMEIIVEFKQKEKSTELNKHINFDINQLRENTTKLIMNKDDPNVKKQQMISKTSSKPEPTTETKTTKSGSQPNKY